MHDIDRTQPEAEFDVLEAGEFEFPEEVEEFGDTEAESPFTEAEVMQLASDALELTDEAELDQFLGGVARMALRKLRGAAPAFFRSGLAQQLLNKVKPLAKRL